MNRHSTAMLLILVSLMLLLGSCREVQTSVKVENGPSFSLRGSGRLAIFTVYAPLSGQRIAFPDGDVASVVWKIRASEGYFKGTRVQDLKLPYGKVPDGYEQLVPERSQGAPPLTPGMVYSFFAETTDAPISSGYFYMDKSGPIQTKVPDLCVMLSEGRKIRVNCKRNTADPYQEPGNLEELVQRNRIDDSTSGHD